MSHQQMMEPKEWWHAILTEYLDVCCDHFMHIINKKLVIRSHMTPIPDCSWKFMSYPFPLPPNPSNFLFFFHSYGHKMGKSPKKRTNQKPTWTRDVRYTLPGFLGVTEACLSTLLWGGGVTGT